LELRTSHPMAIERHTVGPKQSLSTTAQKLLFFELVTYPVEKLLCSQPPDVPTNDLAASHDWPNWFNTISGHAADPAVSSLKARPVLLALQMQSVHVFANLLLLPLAGWSWH
jgi:hypothetical protein